MRWLLLAAACAVAIAAVHWWLPPIMTGEFISERVVDLMRPVHEDWHLKPYTKKITVPCNEPFDPEVGMMTCVCVENWDGDYCARMRGLTSEASRVPLPSGCDRAALEFEPCRAAWAAKRRAWLETRDDFCGWFGDEPLPCTEQGLMRR